MNLFTLTRREPRIPYIEIIEPSLEDCPSSALAPEGNVKLQNYRLLNENIRAYTPTGDIHTSPDKRKLVSKFDVCCSLSPPRTKILELLRPEDPGRDALEAIVRPAPRRGLTRPLDDDTRRFLQRALESPSPLLSMTATPEPQHRPSEQETVEKQINHDDEKTKSQKLTSQVSLADELREAEEDERSGGNIRRGLLREYRMRSGMREAVERDRMGRLALSVEEDEVIEDCGLTATARRLDALLAESRELHEELVEIQEDLQAQSARAGRCTAAARALRSEARALRYLDDVVALLKGDVAAAVRAREWPFAIGRRQPGRNYII